MYYIFTFFIVFLVLYFSLIYLSKGLDNSDYRVSAVKLLIPLILLTGVIYISVNFFHVDMSIFVVPSIIGLIISYTYPVIYYLTNYNGKIGFLHCYDFVWGIYSVIELILITMILGYFINSEIIYRIIYCIIIIGFLTPSIVTILYYLIYRKVIDISTIQTIYYTQKYEVIEFFKTISSFEKFLILLGGLCFIVAIFLLSNFSIVLNSFKITDLFIMNIFFWGIIYFTFIVKGQNALIRKTGLIKLVLEFCRFQRSLAQYNVKHKEAMENLKFEHLLSKSGNTFILVIGESANTDHMSALCEYNRDTTPWLTEMSKSDKILTFNHMYSSFVQTAKVMELALTNANQYNNINFIDAITIIDAAKSCGFETFWYSNQGVANVENTVVSIIGQKADHYRWTLEDYTSVPYDEALLDYLKSIPQTDSNKLIVLHLKGSHVVFNERYPAEFEVWPVEKNHGLGVNAYDNSIRYTDYILKLIFNYSKSALNLQSMVYFSDHGTDIEEKRKPYFNGFDTVRVPLFIYLSDEYKKRYSETYKNLKQHKDYYITNDLIFNLMLGIMQIKCDSVPFEDDFTKKEYIYTKESLKTNLGKVSLSEDIDH